MTRLIFCYAFFLLSVAIGSHASAQQKTATDTILLGAVVENGDTIGMVYMDDVEVLDRLPARYVKQQQEFNRLRYNVFKVYPYAVMAAGILKDADVELERLPNKRARKDYIKAKERELKGKFKGELENLSVTQGQILVKLINRQTGKNCYSILREMKGGFNAVIYQSVALLFSNNLKREYEPEGRDRDMEAIVKEIEAYNYYRYQQAQQLRAQRAQQMQTRRN